MATAAMIVIGAHGREPAQMGVGVDTSGEPEKVETWTTGKAAEYLADLGVSRRKVRSLTEDGDPPTIRRLPAAPGEWARVLADDVREYRRRQLGGIPSRSGEQPTTSDSHYAQ